MEVAMRRAVLSCLLLAGLSSAPESRVTAGDDPGHIPCPLKSVRVEILTEIPKPWWQTPQEGGVVRASVETIAGAPTLVCHYQAYGHSVPVMRAFPEGVKTCAPKGNAFYCR
jgi:hypothetical protein